MSWLTVGALSICAWEWLPLILVQAMSNLAGSGIAQNQFTCTVTSDGKCKYDGNDATKPSCCPPTHTHSITHTHTNSLLVHWHILSIAIQTFEIIVCDHIKTLHIQVYKIKYMVSSCPNSHNPQPISPNLSCVLLLLRHCVETNCCYNLLSTPFYSIYF